MGSGRSPFSRSDRYLIHVDAPIWGFENFKSMCLHRNGWDYLYRFQREGQLPVKLNPVKLLPFILGSDEQDYPFSISVYAIERARFTEIFDWWKVEGWLSRDDMYEHYMQKYTMGEKPCPLYLNRLMFNYNL